MICGAQAIKLMGEHAKLFALHRGAGIAADIAAPAANTDSWPSFIELCEDLDLLFVPARRGARKATVKPGLVLNRIESALGMWKPLVSFHKFFSFVEDHPWAMARYLLEVTCFVSKASEYLSAAARHAPTPKLKKILTKMERDERDHYKMLLKDLGLSEKDFAAHDPAPGTHAVFTQLFHLAVTDPRSLLISTALFETDPEEGDGIRQFYKSVTQLTKIPTDRFVEHHIEDIEAGHIDLWRSAVDGLKKVSYEQASKWISDLHMTKHMLDLWHDSIQIECSSLEKPAIAPIMKNIIRTRPELGSVQEPRLE